MVAPLIANGVTLRVTRVDKCGRPVCGDSAFVTECWASLSMEAEIDEGEDIEFRAANGRLCGSKPACPTLKHYEVTAELFQASPELMEIMTAAPVLHDHAGNPNGFDTCSLPCRQGFALEMWAEVLEAGDVCDEDAEGEGAWMYVLLPWLTQGQLSDLEVGNEAVTFELTAKTRSVGGWGEGPWDDLMSQDDAGTPGPMLVPMEKGCHRRIMIVDQPPPEPSDTYVETFPCEESGGEESESETGGESGESSGGESSGGESGESGEELMSRLLSDPKLLDQLKRELARA